MTVDTRSDDRLHQWLDGLFRQHSKFVYQIAYTLTGSCQDADDVVQDVFLRLSRNGIPAGIRQNPRAYLCRTASNQGLDALRKRKSERLAGESIDSLEIAVRSPDSYDDRIERIRLAMTQMKPRFVELLNLFYMQGRSCAEIAEIQ